jgi:hypothetical protein
VDAGGAAVGGVGKAVDPAGLFEAVEAVGHGGGGELAGGEELAGMEAVGLGGGEEGGEDLELPEGEAEGGEGVVEFLFEGAGEAEEAGGVAEGGGVEAGGFGGPVSEEVVEEVGHGQALSRKPVADRERPWHCLGGAVSSSGKPEPKSRAAARRENCMRLLDRIRPRGRGGLG